MRTLYLTNAAHIGGGNRSLLSLWRALKARGVSPVAVCPSDGPMARACEDLGVPCEVVDYYQPSWREPLCSWRSFQRWCRLMREWKIDVVHANDPIGARSVCLAASRQKIPLVCHVQFPPAPAFIVWAFRYLPKPDCIICCSHAAHQEITSDFRKACPNTEQVVIHNYVVMEDFSPCSEKQVSHARVGIVANLLPVKGHLDFLQMAFELTKGGTEAEYWIIGEDVFGAGYRDVLERRVRELGLQERVSFLGHCANVPQLLAELDVVVCSSHVEPFGICLIEAMASEKPVVATRVGGIPEVVEEGVTGILVPPASPRELARSVKGLLHDADLREQMGKAGRKRVQELFTHDMQAEKIFAIYQRVSGRGATAKQQ